MPKVAEFRVLTANRLGDGRVVYFGDGGWSDNFAAAQIVRGEAEAEAAEAEGRAAVADRLVVEPYLIDVEEAEDGYVPSRLRERIRALGPTTGSSLPLAEAS